MGEKDRGLSGQHGWQRTTWRYGLQFDRHPGRRGKRLLEKKERLFGISQRFRSKIPGHDFHAAGRSCKNTIIKRRNIAFKQEAALHGARIFNPPRSIRRALTPLRPSQCHHPGLPRRHRHILRAIRQHLRSICRPTYLKLFARAIRCIPESDARLRFLSHGDGSGIRGQMQTRIARLFWG